VAEYFAQPGGQKENWFFQIIDYTIPGTKADYKNMATYNPGPSIFKCPSYQDNYESMGRGAEYSYHFNSDDPTPLGWSVGAAGDAYLEAGGNGLNGAYLSDVAIPSRKAMVHDIHSVNQNGYDPLFGSAPGWNHKSETYWPIPWVRGFLIAGHFVDQTPHSHGKKYGTQILFVDGHAEHMTFDSDKRLPRDIWFIDGSLAP
jgi:prepilin-type processing-associated H-X9-DG protein